MRSCPSVVLAFVFSACGLFLADCAHAPASTPTPTPAPPTPATAPAVTTSGAAPVEAPDPFLWLEGTDDPKALAWVKARDGETVAKYGSGENFDHLKSRILEMLDSETRIPYVAKRGNLYYNLWHGKTHPRGILRRTTLAEYAKAKPRWETVLDVDALAKAENENWVYHGLSCLRPASRHCLVALSRGGADADVIREFDLQKKAFVKDGFTLPEAKSDVSWIDADDIYVATDFGPGSMTTSGYPRMVKRWKRGTALASATLVEQCPPEQIQAFAQHDPTPGFQRDVVGCAVDAYDSDVFVLGADGKPARVDVPRDADVDFHREWLTVQPRKPWSLRGVTYPAGSLLAARLDDFMHGKQDVTVLFAPTDTRSLAGHSWTRDHLILDELDNVVSRIEVLTPQAGEWKRAPLGGAPPLSAVEAGSVDDIDGNDYFMTVSSFLQPTTLYHGTLGGKDAVVLKQEPVYFDASKLEARQAFAISKDGTRVPYFLIGPKGMKLDGSTPTLLYGYGGFEISLTPDYNPIAGRGWLERGGVYVIANIRGGGEYGPRWHQAAVRENRPRAYEDFAAVANDLVKHGITSRAHLGALGGSNGGLLMGNMLTLYPDLWGAIVCEVALLDMKRYTHLSAGASWIAEYGNPDVPADWKFLRTFSPYQNVKAGVKYPPILFTTSTRDDRVGPAHARKMAARMLSFGDDVSFYENVEGGHGEATNHEEAAFMAALGYEYLWQHVK